MFLEISLILISSLFYLLTWLNKKNSITPPGPFVWPFIGNLPQIANASPNPLLAISNLSKIYGPIYSLRTGLKDIVVISSKSLLDTLLLKEETQGRDNSGMMWDRSMGGRNLGISLSAGQSWKETRAWTFKTLKNLGFGKTNTLEHFIQDEMEELFLKIGNSSIIEMESLMGPSIMTISYQMISCRTLSDQDKRNIELIYHANDEFMNSTVFGMGLANAYPFLRHVMPSFTGSSAQKKCAAANKIISNQLLNDARHSNSDSNFAELFVREMELEKNNPNTIFFEENFQLVLDDIFLGSSETTNSLLKGIFLFMVLHPEIQQKVFEEIISIAPQHIEFSDMKRMPFTQAVIHESMRLTNVLPNLVPHTVTKDFIFEGYLIKKDVIILPDMFTCYTDEKVWNHPFQFNPMRYIDANGKFTPSKHLMPFGTGPRNCPGELHGTITVFLFFTRLIQKYMLSVPEGDTTPRTDMRSGLTAKPYPFRVLFSSRSN